MGIYYLLLTPFPSGLSGPIRFYVYKCLMDHRPEWERYTDMNLLLYPLKLPVVQIFEKLLMVIGIWMIPLGEVRFTFIFTRILLYFHQYLDLSINGRQMFTRIYLRADQCNLLSKIAQKDWWLITVVSSFYLLFHSFWLDFWGDRGYYLLGSCCWAARNPCKLPSKCGPSTS